MLRKKAVVQKIVLVLMGLLMALTAVSCNAPVQEEVEIEADVATRPARNRQLYSRLGQSGDEEETAVSDTDDTNDTDNDESEDDEEYIDWFTIAAEAMGMNEDTMWDALIDGDGSSIVDLATANGADPAAIATAIIVAETEWINDFAASGDITADEAAEWIAELDEEVQDFMNGSSWALWDGVDWYTVAAEAIGVDEDTLWEAESIAAAAEANGVDAQTVIDAIAAAESEWLNGLVAADELTAEDVEEWTAEMDGEIREFVEESWEYDEFDDFEGADWFTVAADAVNMDEDAFWEALMEGGSIADLAAAQNVDVQTLTDAIIAAESASFAELVADGSITQEEADEWAAEINEEVPEFLNDSSWALWEGIDWYTIAQEMLGMDEDAMWDALDNGQSLTELADAQGVDAQTIAAAVADAEVEWLDSLVASGELTQEEVDEWATELDAEIDFFMNEKWDY